MYASKMEITEKFRNAPVFQKHLQRYSYRRKHIKLIFSEWKQHRTVSENRSHCASPVTPKFQSELLKSLYSIKYYIELNF